jgi:hypothetical protein
MTFVKAPEDLDWTELMQKLLAPKEVREISSADLQSGRQLKMLQVSVCE